MNGNTAKVIAAAWPDLMTELYSEMHRNIQDVFKENEVQIMTPAYERDPPEPKVVPKGRRYTQLATESRKTSDI